MVGPVKPRLLDSSLRLLPLKALPLFRAPWRRGNDIDAWGGCRSSRDAGLERLHQRGLIFSSFSSCRQPGGQSRARSLRRWIILIFACWLTHDSIRQGLPLSTCGRRHRSSGPRVGRGFPLPYTRQGLPPGPPDTCSPCRPRACHAPIPPGAPPHEKSPR